MEERYAVLVNTTHYKQSMELMHKLYDHYPSQEEIESAVTFYRNYDYRGEAMPVINYARVEKRYI